jgi:Tfp pilus assembly major pilin PilA
MAALPPENSARLIVDYLWRGRPSQTMYRFKPGVSSGAAIATVATFHNAVKNRFYNNWSVPGTCRWYNEGQTFSTEFLITAVAAGTGGPDILTVPDALRTEVLGRDAFGKRVAWYLAGFYTTLNRSQRATTGDMIAVTDLIAGFTAMCASGSLCTITNNTPVLKQYVNFTVNDYITRQARGG